MARRYKRDAKGRFAGGGGGGGGNRRSSGGPSTGRAKAGAFVKSRAQSAALRAAAQGVTVSKTVKGVEVRANVSIHRATRERPSGKPVEVSIPKRRGGRRRARRS